MSKSTCYRKKVSVRNIWPWMSVGNSCSVLFLGLNFFGIKSGVLSRRKVEHCREIPLYSTCVWYRPTMSNLPKHVYISSFYVKIWVRVSLSHYHLVLWRTRFTSLSFDWNGSSVLICTWLYVADQSLARGMISLVLWKPVSFHLGLVVSPFHSGESGDQSTMGVEEGGLGVTALFFKRLILRR